MQAVDSGQNIILDQVTVTVMDALSKDSRFCCKFEQLGAGILFFQLVDRNLDSAVANTKQS